MAPTCFVDCPSRSRETTFRHWRVYKATITGVAGTSGPIELFFDKDTGVLVKMNVPSSEGPMGGEVLEINPVIDDSVFSLEPPAGATVIDTTK